PRFLAPRMSFLTAASDKSSTGSGVSGVSGASFSGASTSFSFSFAAVFALLAIKPLLTSPPGERHTSPPTLWGTLHLPLLVPAPVPDSGPDPTSDGRKTVARPQSPSIRAPQCRRCPLNSD